MRRCEKSWALWQGVKGFSRWRRRRTLRRPTGCSAPMIGGGKSISGGCMSISVLLTIVSSSRAPPCGIGRLLGSVHFVAAQCHGCLMLLCSPLPVAAPFCSWSFCCLCFRADWRREGQPERSNVPEEMLSDCGWLKPGHRLPCWVASSLVGVLCHFFALRQQRTVPACRSLEAAPLARRRPHGVWS